jgi:hypothetical protein
MPVDDATVATPRQKGAVEDTDTQSSTSAQREDEEFEVVQVEPIVERKRNKGCPVPDSKSVVRMVRLGEIVDIALIMVVQI